MWEKYHQAIHKQIQNSCTCLAPLVEQTFVQLINRLKVKTLKEAQHLLLTGCGDSWMCGLAASWAFKRFTSLQVQAPPAMEFSRHLASQIEPPGLLYAISISGKVSRTHEALVRAQQRGLHTVLFTANPQSPIARDADVVIELTLPKSDLILPETLSSTVSIVALLVAAIYLGECRGDISSPVADELYQSLRQADALLGQVYRAAQPAVEQFLAEHQQAHLFQFLGSGIGYALALYGTMKLVEAASLPALASDLEEWAHAGFFLKPPPSQPYVPVIFICLGERVKDRAAELLKAIKQVKLPTFLLYDTELSSEVLPPDHLRIEHSLVEELAIVPFLIPLQVMASELVRQRKCIPFDAHLPDKLELNSRVIYQSRLSKLPEASG